METRLRGSTRKGALAPWILGTLLILIVLVALTREPLPVADGTGDPGTGRVQAFSGERAYALLESLCVFGPRVPGTRAHGRARRFLIEQARAHADRVELEDFPAATPPYASGITLTNVVARFAPDREPRVLLGAHWDSRPRADEDPDSTRHQEPVLGANDAASACAVLLHIAEILAARPPAVGVDLVFFDGEDGGQRGSASTYCLGSREHVRRLRGRRPSYVVVLDMVGDRNLDLPAEGYSAAHAPELVRMVWGRAEKLGLTAFTAEPKVQVFDDHMPFLEAGIPAVDVIDFDYPHWHTTADTPDKCSPASLETVGVLVEDLVYEP